jgi:hypothetical protein
VCDPNSIDAPWQFCHCVRSHCKQQFEIFTAMKRELQWIQRTAPAKFNNLHIDGKKRRMDQRTDLAFPTNMI